MKFITKNICCIMSISMLSACSFIPELSYKSATRKNAVFKADSTCRFESFRKDRYKELQACKQEVFYPSKDGTRLMAVLEMDEQGRFVSEEHAQNIMNEIHKRNEEIEKLNSSNGMPIYKKPIVSLYVHGWNHNSRVSDSDLHEFTNAVQSLYDSQGVGLDQKGPIRHSIGIYVAWRGQVLYPTFANQFFTFWNRKSVSEDVGRSDLMRFIMQLDSEVKGSSDESNNGTLILAAHSFGASVLYNAIGPVLVSRFYESLAARKEQPETPLKGVGDIVVLLNPAIEANRFVALREAVWRAGAKDPKIFDHNFKPFFMVIGSNDDFPLNNAFPSGRFLGTLFFENYAKTYIVDGNGSKGVREVKERKMDRRAVGNYPEFYTHWLSLGKEQGRSLPIVSSLITPFSGLTQAFPSSGSSGDVPDKAPWLACDIRRSWLQEAYDSSKGSNWKVQPNINPHNHNQPVIISTQFIREATWKRTGLTLRLEPENVTEKAEATTWDRNPYWFIRANGSMLPGHNGIWNKGMGCFILSVMVADSDKASDLDTTNSIKTSNKR